MNSTSICHVITKEIFERLGKKRKQKATETKNTPLGYLSIIQTDPAIYHFLKLSLRRDQVWRPLPFEVSFFLIISVREFQYV